MHVKEALTHLIKLQLIVGFFLVTAVTCLFMASGLYKELDAKLIDIQSIVLRSISPKQSLNEVVIVGIDEETVSKIKEPMGLWHRNYGDFLRAAALGEARIVGMDVVLPDRSFNEILPEYDEALMSGILVAKRTLPLVFAITIDNNGNQRAVFRKFELVAGANSTGLALFPIDSDHVVRRFDERLGIDGTNVNTFAGQIARRLKLTPQPGIIDYSIGSPFNYVPLIQVLRKYQSNDIAGLKTLFEGKAVLLGSLLPNEDRVRQPINLAAWENSEITSPGVLIHAQALRSMMGAGLVKPVPTRVVAIMALAAILTWFIGLRFVAAVGVFVLLAGGLFAASLWGFRSGWFLPLSATLGTSFCALFGRAGLDAAIKLKERLRLRRSFAGYVSPVVMDAILTGKLSPALGGSRQYVCVLFADIRNYTTRSESMTPEGVINLLNRYFERVVRRIHEEDGVVISFMGDGIMAIFGAPQALENPCKAAFFAAKSMLGEVSELNNLLCAENIPPIEIGIGMHAGEAVVGHVGSSSRHDYTAIGDVTNVAARLEGLTKDVGYRITCSKRVSEALELSDELAPLGPLKIKGHTPVEVFGWGKV